MAALPTRSLSQHLRHSIHPSQLQQQQHPFQPHPPALVARIEEKKAELQNLQELRELSAAVAGQMEALEQRLATLTDGTEAIAAVIGNWHNVLRAINMASAKFASSSATGPALSDVKDENDSDDGDAKMKEQPLPLPQTLVRIPTEHAPTVQAHAEPDLSVNEG